MARGFLQASSNYLQRSDTCGISGYPFTFACWFYASDLDITGTRPLMRFSENSDGTGDNHDLRVRDAPDYDVLAVSNDQGVAQAFANTSTQASTDTWHHAVGVWASATDRRVFLDGSGKGTNTTSVNYATQAYTSFSLAGTNYWSGSIGEGGLWNVALTDAEAAVLATGISPLAVRPQSLVAHWPLIGRTSPEIDLVGGFDMTLNNSPTAAAHPRVIYPGLPQAFFAQAAAAPAQQQWFPIRR